MTDKSDIAVIGTREFTLGFRLVGVSNTIEKQDYEEQIADLIDREDIGIVIVEREDLKELPPRMREDVKESVDPVVVPLSESGEFEDINTKIKKVIGADITG